MGVCQTGGPSETGELVFNERKEEKGGTFARVGNPPQTLFINMKNINKSIKNNAERNEVNSMIFDVMQSEKEFREPLIIRKRPKPDNKLEDTYYIPSLKAFYIGQWVFDNEVGANIPGGIGRLYEKNTISEGVFKTFILDYAEENKSQSELDIDEAEAEEEDMLRPSKQPQEPQKNSDKQEVRESGKQQSGKMTQKNSSKNSEKNNEKRSQKNSQHLSEKHEEKKPEENKEIAGAFFGAGVGGFLNQTNLEEKQKDDMSKLINLIHSSSNPKKNKKKVKSFEFVVKLCGEGRINSKEIISGKRKKQYIMEGYFDEGVLNGKGVLRIFDFDAQIFSYEGEWKMGSKNGKGIEKGKQVDSEENSKEYKYEGRFVENMRNGKGTLSFFISKKQEHTIEADRDKYDLMLREDEVEMRINVKKKIKIREYRENLINEALKEKKFPENDLTVNFKKSLLSDMQFNMLKEYRKVFEELYIGEFENNLMSGDGYYQWPTNKFYKGSWLNDKMHGKGEFFWPQGEFFQGEYQEDERFGKGIMVWSMYRRYRGNWAFSMRHGYGESIELSQKDELNSEVDYIRLTIRGALWKQNKAVRTIFTEVFKIKKSDYMDIEDLEKAAEQEEKMTKQKEKDDDDESK